VTHARAACAGGWVGGGDLHLGYYTWVEAEGAGRRAFEQRRAQAFGLTCGGGTPADALIAEFRRGQRLEKDWCTARYD